MFRKTTVCLALSLALTSTAAAAEDPYSDYMPGIALSESFDGFTDHLAFADDVLSSGQELAMVDFLEVKYNGAAVDVAMVSFEEAGSYYTMFLTETSCSTSDTVMQGCWDGRRVVAASVTTPGAGNGDLASVSLWQYASGALVNAGSLELTSAVNTSGEAEISVSGFSEYEDVTIIIELPTDPDAFFWESVMDGIGVGSGIATVVGIASGGWVPAGAAFAVGYTLGISGSTYFRWGELENGNTITLILPGSEDGDAQTFNEYLEQFEYLQRPWCNPEDFVIPGSGGETPAPEEEEEEEEPNSDTLISLTTGDRTW